MQENFFNKKIEKPNNNPESGSAVDFIRKNINNKVAESTLPTEEYLGYKSMLATYGGKLKEYDDGKMIYETGGITSLIDQKGDAVLRHFDDNQVKNPWELMRKHPKAFLKTLPFNKGKRYKGGAEDIIANAKRLGLEEYYCLNPKGVEIKKPELIKRGIALWDIYRQDKINSPILNKIDRFDAVAIAGAYLNELHTKHGAVGEYNIYPVIFEEHDDNGKVGKPVLLLPAMIYNPDKHTSDIDKKSTELLDLLSSVGAEEWRRSDGDKEKITFAMMNAITNYEDNKVIKMVESYAKRGRLTLPGDEKLTENFSNSAKISRQAFSAHNVQRLQMKKEMSATLRKIIIDICEKTVKKRV